MKLVRVALRVVNARDMFYPVSLFAFIYNCVFTTFTLVLFLSSSDAWDLNAGRRSTGGAVVRVTPHSRAGKNSSVINDIFQITRAISLLVLCAALCNWADINARRRVKSESADHGIVGN